MNLSTENSNETRAALCLKLTPGLGNVRILTLLKRFGNAEAVLKAPPNVLCETPGIDSKTVSQLHNPQTLEKATQELERAQRQAVTLVTWGQANYPNAFDALYDPPPILWIRGHLPQLERVPKAIGIVGTRRSSPQGVAFAKRLAQELAESGIAVVSGLARGIDTAAHTACIHLGKPTIGVLGSGVDVVYPSENTRLAQSMITISEHPLGTRPAAYHFPSRNRIIAALSAGIVVVEGAVDSGAMITAHNALECGRSVFAVPGRPLEPLSAGPHKLLREGAVLCESANDILEEFNWGVGETHIPDLPDTHLKIYQALEGTPLPDELVLTSGLSVAEVQTALMMLSIQGLVQELPGGRYMKAK